MNLSRKIFLISFLLITSIVNGQRLLKLSVDLRGSEEHLSYINRNGISYASLKELSALIASGSYYNQDASKLEMKFPDYNLKFTSKSQFIVLTSKTGNRQYVYQIPVSTLLIKNDIYIPLVYCVSYLKTASGKNIVFNEKAKNLSITAEPVNSEAFIEKLNRGAGAENIKPTAKPAAAANSKFDIYGISIEEKSNGTLLRLKSNKILNVPRHSINNGILYVFFSGVTFAPGLTDDLEATGLVKKIKLNKVTAQNTQLECTLAEGYSTSEAFKDVESRDILITIHNKILAVPSSNLDEARNKWQFDAVVIDAGHGGKDPGAIGVTGVREKNVNLAIALALGNLIAKNMPDVKVIYTRRTDEFIELYKRGKIANENGGKLFISIHCNSTEKKPTSLSGFEVYLLRPGRTKEAISIAEFENSVIKYEDNPARYQQLTDENFILVSMAHSQYMRYSEKFSDVLNQNWSRSVQIPSLGVKQAGFYVLVGASMPGVLIETGFLSNRKDEAFLNSRKGQAEIAGTIFNALRQYKQSYDREIKDGK